MSGSKEIKRRFPEIIMDSCQDCPYGRWVNYDCAPTGYECFHDDAYRDEIISEYAWEGRLNKKRLNKKYKKIPIPDWCSLEKVGVKSDG